MQIGVPAYSVVRVREMSVWYKQAEMRCVPFRHLKKPSTFYSVARYSSIMSPLPFRETWKFVTN